jgi:hypothetical protein
MGFPVRFLAVFKNILCLIHDIGLNLLKEFVAFDALHDSSAQDPERRCHPGTRESVLKMMHKWIDNPNAEEKIFWLHGPAGVGKSAIAQTIAHSYERNLLSYDAIRRNERFEHLDALPSH